MFSLTDKVAVVTGAGRGIGQAIAQTLAAAGAKVAVVSRTEANSTKVAALINASHPESAKPYAVDIANATAVAEMGKTVLADFGRVDILINNAGLTRDGLALRMSEEDWDLVLDTNLKGAFNAVKAFQRSILKSTAGRIINISSVVGLTGAAGQINYAASKAGLIGFTKSVAREFAGRGVTSNAIAPGFIDTDMTHVLSDEIKAGIKAKIPLNSFGNVDDIAQAVLFLASSAARYITGQVLTVDGGLVM